MQRNKMLRRTGDSGRASTLTVSAYRRRGERRAGAANGAGGKGGSPRKRRIAAAGAGRRKRGAALGPRNRRGAVQPASPAFRSGFRAGIADARRFSLEGKPYQKKALNHRFLEHACARKRAGPSWTGFIHAAKGYVRGYFHGRRKRPHDWLMLPTARSVAAIVSVMNEEATIGRILDQLGRLPLDEVYVLVNGSIDHSFQQARGRSRAVVLSFPEPLGHDVGRALGAKLAQSDILLFLDGDILLSGEDLVPFIGGIENGLDVALNDIAPFLRVFSKRDQVTHLKQFLNASLGRPDLGASSLTAVPHALTRRAVDTLGAASLMVPPKAQVLALHSGLNVAASGSVNVIRGNKRRQYNTGATNRVADLIVGDHLEALKLAGELAGERLAFADTMRNRDIAGGET